MPLLFLRELNQSRANSQPCFPFIFVTDFGSLIPKHKEVTILKIPLQVNKLSLGYYRDMKLHRA